MSQFTNLEGPWSAVRLRVLSSRPAVAPRSDGQHHTQGGGYPQYSELPSTIRMAPIQERPRKNY
jgi:hypothetical protein